MIKKSILILFIILMLNLVSIVSAVDISLTKSEYHSGETLQAEISGNFVDTLKLENIGIYREGSVHKSPAESGILKSESKYLFYAILPELEGKYSLKIENTRYKMGNVETQEPLIKNFSIKQSNSSYLSFSPGYILASKDFQVRIKAYNKEQEVNVEFSPSNFKQSFNLAYGEEKTVYISISGIENTTKSNVKINSYTIPTTINPPAIIDEDTTKARPTRPIEDFLEVTPKKINATIIPESDYYFKLKLTNNEGIEVDLNLSTSDKEIKVKPEKIENFWGEEEVTVTVNSKKGLEGTITISYEDESIEIPISIYITKNQSKVDYNTVPLNKEKTCKSMNGQICNSTRKEICNGTVTYDSLNQPCCTGRCITKQSSSYSWIWGLLVLALIGVGLWFLYKKSKEDKSSKKPREIINKRAEDYQKRMNPEPERMEVRKGLTKS